MNIATGYSATGSISDYAATKTSHTSSKPFTIPMEKIETPMLGPITFIGYDSFDPFKEIAQTGSINIPKYMQTKTEPTRSDEEILKDIEELAKKHAQQGIRREKDEEYLILMDEFISSVSPDRESILKRTVKEIYERTNQGAGYSMSAAFRQVGLQRTKKEEEEKEPIDYFLEMLKNKGKGNGGGTIVSETRNGSYYTAIVDHGGGMMTTFNYVNDELASIILSGNNYSDVGIELYSNKVAVAQFFDDNGEKIADYNGNKLSQKYTEAEGARLDEIVSTYNAAYYS